MSQEIDHLECLAAPRQMEAERLHGIDCQLHDAGDLVLVHIQISLGDEGCTLHGGCSTIDGTVEIVWLFIQYLEVLGGTSALVG